MKMHTLAFCSAGPLWGQAWPKIANTGEPGGAEQGFPEWVGRHGGDSIEGVADVMGNPRVIWMPPPASLSQCPCLYRRSSIYEWSTYTTLLRGGSGGLKSY